MNEGVLQQVGTPTEVYLYPANLFVAQFIGSPVMDVAPTVVREVATVPRKSHSTGLKFGMPADLIGMLNLKAARSDLSLGIRPEGVEVSLAERPGYRPVEAHLIQPYGGFDIVDLKSGDRTLRARTVSGFVPRPGTPVFARIDPAQAHFFDNRDAASSVFGWSAFRKTYQSFPVRKRYQTKAWITLAFRLKRQVMRGRGPDMARIRLENISKVLATTWLSEVSISMWPTVSSSCCLGRPARARRRRSG